MRHVKNMILRNLQIALIECNKADLGEDNYNDLDPICSRQESAYGHISDAIRVIGGDEMIEAWINHGDFPPMARPNILQSKFLTTGTEDGNGEIYEYIDRQWYRVDGKDIERCVLSGPHEIKDITF